MSTAQFISWLLRFRLSAIKWLWIVRQLIEITIGISALHLLSTFVMNIELSSQTQLFYGDNFYSFGAVNWLICCSV